MLRFLTLVPLAVSLLFGCGPSNSGSAPPTVEGLSNPTWEVQYTDSTALFIGLSAVDEQVVWVSGNGGRFVRTDDGGQSWTGGTVPGAEDLQFRDVHAFDADHAFLLSIGNGPSSRIYRTADGGTSWTLVFQNEDPNAFFDCFSFWNPSRGLAFSDSHEGRFHLISTEDGGQTWSRIDPALLPEAREGEGAFASSGTCVVTRPGGHAWFSTGASGVDTRILRTEDYGASWSEAPTPIASSSPSSGVFSLTFLDDSIGMALGGEYGNPDTLVVNVAVTSDGGASWSVPGQSHVTGAIFGGSYVPGAPTPSVVVVAPTGTDFSKDNGRTWTRIDSTSFWTVGFVSPGAGWAAGPSHIARLRNAR